MKEPKQRAGPLTFRLGLAVLAVTGLLGGSPGAWAAGEPAMTGCEIRKVVPVGRAVGIKLFSDGVLVVGFSQIPAPA